MKKIAILQSNYIPWKGYFDLINSVDEFILYDDAQYTKRDWRNRNIIKTINGIEWLTIPVKTKGNYKQLIKETEVQDTSWTKKHFKAICLNYSKAEFFFEIKEHLEVAYKLCENEKYLSNINFVFIKLICEILGINTSIKRSIDYQLDEGKNEKLISLCKQVGATHYLSGPAAKSYVNEELFKENGIEVEWMNYEKYNEYKQLFSPPFVHGVSIIDLIANIGIHSTKQYLKIY